jgi:hypothetical protein
VSIEPERAQRQAADSTWLDRVARLGIVMYGVVHLMVAWLVLRLGFGDTASPASGSGAFHDLARTTVGRVSLTAVAVGFLALVLWQAVEAVLGYRYLHGVQRLGLRATSGAKVVVFGVMGVNALMLSTGSGGGGGGTDGYTARLMRLPAGPLLVGAVGVVIVVVAGCLAYFGLAENFRDVMSSRGESGSTGTAYVLLGKVGYVTRAVAIALVGALFLYAALTHDPRKSGGLDQALHKVLQQPVGGPALVVMAAGLACFGLFCLAWARHLDR